MAARSDLATFLVGNTSGSTVLQGVPLYLSGGSNVTVHGLIGTAGHTLAIHGGAGGTGGGGGVAIAAGTQTATTNTVVFSNSNGVTFGMSGSSRVTASVETAYAASTHSHGNPSLALTNLTGTTASNSAGLTISLSAAAAGAGGGIAAAAGTQTQTSGTLAFANSNGLTWGMSGSSQVTASHNGLTTAALSNHSHAFATTTTGGASIIVGTSNSAGVTIGVPAYLTTARASNDAAGLNTAGTSVTWTVNSSGISLNAGAYLTTAANSTHSHGNPTLNLTNLSGTTASASNGFTLSLSAAAPGGGAAQTFSAGTTSGAANPIHFSNANGVTFGLGTGASSSVITASVGAGGGGNATIQSFEPNPIITGTAYSSHNPATTYWMPIGVVQDVAFRWVDVIKSVSIAFPAGTSSGVAQSFVHGYTHYVSLFSRKNTSNSSMSLSYMTHGSFCATYSFTHTSVSQGATMFYLTNSTGGTSSTNSTSNATANLAAYFNGARLARIPFPATTLTAGEYWFAQAHSTSRASTGGTATTCALFSNLHIAPQNINVARFGSTNATNGSIGYLHPVPQGYAAAHTSTTDMNASAITASVRNLWYVKLMDF